MGNKKPFSNKASTIKTHSENGNPKDLKKLIVAILVLVNLLLFADFISARDRQLNRQIKFRNKKDSTLSPTPTPLSPTPVVKGAQFIPIPTIDPNPFVNCQFTHLPDQKMRTSECTRSFECQIGSQWYIYTSRSKCDQDQSAYWSNHYRQFNTTLPAYSPSTYTYTPSPLLYQTTPTQAPDYSKLIDHQRRIDECKQDCVVNAVNQIEAGFWGDPNAELSDEEYSNKQYQIEKLIRQCQGNCENY